MRLVRITHPFHPLNGRDVACVGERYNRYGRRLLLRVDDVTVCSVPPQWTDLVAPDPEIVIGKQLFGTDGIRGVAGEYPLDFRTIHAFGVALAGTARHLHPDPEIVIGEYRALFRVADLLELERLVDQLRKRDSWKKPDDA